MMPETTTETCTRCGADVPSIFTPPPGDRESWWRNQVCITRREVTHVLRFRMFKLRWLPKNPMDQLAETYTTLSLCDQCAGAVFLYAQGKTPA